jgi:DNA invertase Pin-like site-specific DNA recombinase
MPTGLAFYGRCSTEDAQDPVTSRAWQLRAATNLLAVAAPDAQIVEEFFDIGQSRSLPWRRRIEAARLMAALQNPARGWNALVVGEGQRCWYGSQFSEVAPVLEHHGVQLYVPELGGAYDPRNSSHYMLMTLTGGMSRGERQRVQERVRLGMAAQVETQGRYQGGRPPYGYTTESYAPHPNPRKAAEGYRMKRLVVVPEHAEVVQRIFAEFLAGRSFREIVTGLNVDEVPCPSAADPERNRHRDQVGWQIPTVRAIISNARYTGYEVWGIFAKSEQLVDPGDPTLGYRTRLVRSDQRPVRSRDQAHEAIVDVFTWTRADHLLNARADAAKANPGKHARNRGASYPLKGLMTCTICGRRMQVQKSAEPWVRYRCRARDLTPERCWTTRRRYPSARPRSCSGSTPG